MAQEVSDRFEREAGPQQVQRIRMSKWACYSVPGRPLPSTFVCVVPVAVRPLAQNDRRPLGPSHLRKHVCLSSPGGRLPARGRTGSATPIQSQRDGGTMMKTSTSLLFTTIRDYLTPERALGRRYEW